MPYDPSNTYCTPDSVEKRLSKYGTDWAVDVDDADGFRSLHESSYLTDAIEYANNLVDEALAQQEYDITPRPQNAWLSDRARDIAVCRIFTLGGRKCPAVLQADHDAAILKLDGVKDGDRIPGLVKSTVLNTGRFSLPIRVINVR